MRLRSACSASRSTITSKARGSNGSKASSLTNTSVIRVAKLAEGYGPALNFARLDPDEIADPLDVRMCSLVASDTSCAYPGAVEASVLSDGVLRASTVNSERRRVLNERRDTKMLQ